MGHGERTVLMVVHTGRQAALDAARYAVARLSAAGVGVRVLAGEAPELETDAQVFPPVSHHRPTSETLCVAVPLGTGMADDVELVIVLGGDGTVLRGAEIARAAGIPLLGVNLGRVGFLAEAEYEDLTMVVDRIVARDYVVEERMTIDVEVSLGGQTVDRSWALNEASIEKYSRERMVEVLVSIDGRPLSKWGCDGVIFATPTGSTAYNFSAGGPIVWPDVDALLLVPISAHALFARPLVVSPNSTLALELQPNGDDPASKGAVMWCDGRRVLDLPHGARVEVRRGALPVRFARLHHAPFTDRLVAKFALPVDGWRAEK
ncbi:MAG: NAD kinase [Catenulispora sp.]